MASISIRQLALAMSKKSFAELVTYQIRTTSFADLKTAMSGAKSCLSPEIQLEIEEIIRNCFDVTADKRFWDNDCGMVLRFFTSMIDQYLSDRLVDASEKELIEIFHIIVMHCAYRARKNPRMLSFLNKTGRKFQYSKLYEDQRRCTA